MKKLVLVVMDGVGKSKTGLGDAVTLANTPTLDTLLKECPNTYIKAHGTAVGLPSDDDMGNSEVGHNALGCGQVYSQGAKLVEEAIESGDIFNSSAWQELKNNCVKNGSAMHFIGLLSDGNVHSNIEHLIALIKGAKRDGIKRVFAHVLLDGRDVPATSALTYVDRLESAMAELNDDNFHACIASGGGRMVITMDRYEANWKMVEEGWNTHVCGEGRFFDSAADAVKTYRAETGKIDQDLPPFVIAKDGKPVGTINDGDSVIFFNFRGDRALEISRAFENRDCRFEKKKNVNVLYAGMLEYDGDAHIPHKYLVSPPEITGTMSEFLVNHGYRQLAISETQKFGHVTYFWNGNRSGKFSDELEEYVEIPSDVVPFEQRPWMKCAEITDVLIDKLRSGNFDFLRVNFPNGDMVGHTGSFIATKVSMEALDLCLARILKVVDEMNGIAIITADHGNADEMLELDKSGNAKTDKNGHAKVKTSHTLNPVPCFFYDNSNNDKYDVIKEDGYGLANVAATVVTLMGEDAPDYWYKSMVKVK